MKHFNATRKRKKKKEKNRRISEGATPFSQWCHITQALKKIIADRL